MIEPLIDVLFVYKYIPLLSLYEAVFIVTLCVLCSLIKSLSHVLPDACEFCCFSARLLWKQRKLESKWSLHLRH